MYASSEELTASVEQASVATEQITKEMEEISNSAEVQNNEVESGAELIGEVTRNIQYVAENASEYRLHPYTLNKKPMKVNN